MQKYVCVYDWRSFYAHAGSIDYFPLRIMCVQLSMCLTVKGCVCTRGACVSYEYGYFCISIVYSRACMFMRVVASVECRVCVRHVPSIGGGSGVCVHVVRLSGFSKSPPCFPGSLTYLPVTV